MMGYKTPNIDRIAKEGALFTDWYGQQSSGENYTPIKSDGCDVPVRVGAWDRRG
jgi:hypothetical protein